MNADNKVHQFERGQHVTYKAASGSMVEAIIRRIHRDGSYTVESRFLRTADGDRVPGYLGFKCRMYGRGLNPALPA